MPIIKPFRGFLPPPNMTSEVSSPPYDVLSSFEALEITKKNPNSFLRIIKPEIDFDLNIKISSDQIHEQGAKNFKALIDNNLMQQDQFESFYIYEIKMDNHIQTGIIAATSITEYNNNIIKKHELTRPEKEDDRTNHINIINANTGPVFLTFKNDGNFQSLIKDKKKDKPYTSFFAEDNTEHTLWKIQSSIIISQFIKYFDSIQNFYIADGHHRAAASSRVQKIRSKKNILQKKGNAYNYFLSAIFPDNEMRILDYNRVIKDLNGLNEIDFLQLIKTNFIITPIKNENKKPKIKSTFSMLLNKKWYLLKMKNEKMPSKYIDCLDASLLQNFLLNPILGIENPRTNNRIDFVGGIRGIKELERRCNLDSIVAFALYPASIQDLIKVADRGHTMPPKSTWFEPKLRSGLVVRVLN